MSCSAGPMMGGKKRGGDEEEPEVEDTESVSSSESDEETMGGRRRRTIMRKGYVAHRRGKTIRVPGRRVRDMGAKGKWRVKHGPGIGELEAGKLMGYATDEPKTQRRRILRKVVKKSGPLKTFRRLQAISTYMKRVVPYKSKTARADRNWVKKTFMKKK